MKETAAAESEHIHNKLLSNYYIRTLYAVPNTYAMMNSYITTVSIASQ